MSRPVNVEVDHTGTWIVHRGGRRERLRPGWWIEVGTDGHLAAADTYDEVTHPDPSTLALTDGSIIWTLDLDQIPVTYIGDGESFPVRPLDH